MVVVVKMPKNLAVIWNHNAFKRKCVESTAKEDSVFVIKVKNCLNFLVTVPSPYQNLPRSPSLFTLRKLLAHSTPKYGLELYAVIYESRREEQHGRESCCSFETHRSLRKCLRLTGLHHEADP